MEKTTSHLTQMIMEQLRPLNQWMEDKNVTELMCNPGGHVFVEDRGILDYKGKLLTENAINIALTVIAKYVNADAISRTKSAIVNASIEDMRFAGAKAPICPDGSYFTIRKHQDKSERPTLNDLIHKLKALTVEQAEIIRSLVIDQHQNCIIAGGTGSGKTTLTNAILSMIPSHERLITVEDSRELQIENPNKLNLLSNDQDNITARDLVKHAMRLRPDRLILGETRGDETYDLIAAFNSGHPGSISTVHADSAPLALTKLEMLYQMSLPANAQMSTDLVRQYIGASVNVVVCVTRKIKVIEGVSRVVRKVEQIIKLTGVENGKYVYEQVG